LTRAELGKLSDLEFRSSEFAPEGKMTHQIDALEELPLGHDDLLQHLTQDHGCGDSLRDEDDEGAAGTLLQGAPLL
jgi:hypothetical protein